MSLAWRNWRRPSGHQWQHRPSSRRGREPALHSPPDPQQHRQPARPDLLQQRLDGYQLSLKLGRLLHPAGHLVVASPILGWTPPVVRREKTCFLLRKSPTVAMLNQERNKFQTLRRARPTVVSQHLQLLQQGAGSQWKTQTRTTASHSEIVGAILNTCSKTLDS